MGHGTDGRYVHGVPARSARSRDEWPFGSAYSNWREDEDLAAMVEHTMSDCVRDDAPAGRTDSLR